MGCVLVVATSAVSAAISIHRGKSLEAMLDLLAIVGLFLTAAVALRGAGALRRLAIAQVIAAVPVALYGIAQHYRPEIFPVSVANSYPGRAAAPFGQPNRLGGYLIAAIPLALALSFAVQDRWLRLFFLAAASILTFCLVLTFSRGAWYGLAAGGLALAALLYRTPDLALKPWAVAAAAVAVIVPVLLLAPRIGARIAPKPAGPAAWNLPIDPEREGSLAMRRAIWSGALAATAARPVAGWGIGTFREAYDRSKSDTLKRLEAEGARTADQAHSFYLKTLTERGALGLAALVLFLAAGLGAGLAALGAGTPAAARVVIVGLLASTAALLVHALFEDNLSSSAHGSVLFANLGLLAAASPGPRNAPASAFRGPIRAGALLTALVAVVGVLASAGSAIAAVQAGSGARSFAAGRIDEARARFAAAEKTAPWDDRYAVYHAKASEAAARGGRGIAAVLEARASYEHALSANASDPVTRHELARLYLTHESAFGAQGVRSAERLLREALEQNPYYAEIRNDLGVALLEQGDRSGAAAAFRRAGEGRRGFVDPLLNLATLQLQDGNEVEARRLIGEALERDPNSARASEMLRGLSGRTGS
jgi:O-antigen ligase/Tfp pilus assembly protein PilF